MVYATCEVPCGQGSNIDSRTERRDRRSRLKSHPNLRSTSRRLSVESIFQDEASWLWRNCRQMCSATALATASGSLAGIVDMDRPVDGTSTRLETVPDFLRSRLGIVVKVVGPFHGIV